MSTTIKIQKPKIPQDIKPVDFYQNEEKYFEMCTINDCVIKNEDIHRIRFEQVVFKNVIFQDVSFKYIELTDVVFDHCDLSNTDFRNGSIHRVEFKDSKILGLNLSDASLGNVLFQNCNAPLISFGYSKLKQVVFDSCLLRNADYYEAKFTKVGLEKCDINEANFERTPLKGMDLSSCTFDRLNVSMSDLAGCAVTSDQAIGFARLLGLIIK
jgi:uncharacterized protein YjbI with pentapeptide repeats